MADPLTHPNNSQPVTRSRLTPSVGRCDQRQTVCRALRQVPWGDAFGLLANDALNRELQIIFNVPDQPARLRTNGKRRPDRTGAVPCGRYRVAPFKPEVAPELMPNGHDGMFAICSDSLPVGGLAWHDSDCASHSGCNRLVGSRGIASSITRTPPTFATGSLSYKR